MLAMMENHTWWVLQVFSVVFACLAFSYIARRVLRRLQTKLAQTPNPWDDAFVDAASRPVAYLIWLLGISFAAKLVKQTTNATIFDFIEPARRIGFVTIGAWFLVRVIKRAEANLGQHRKRTGQELDRTTLTALSNLGCISVIVTAVLISLQSLGYSVSGILAFGGVGGIAIGFAAKDMLANLFGSLMIYMDRPFKIGDWIRSPDREIEGTVEHIGWRVTRILTFDQRPLYVPNSVFSTVSLENPSRMTNRRIQETIGIRYGDFPALSKILDEVRAMLLEHDGIDTQRTLMVNFNTFGASALEFFIYCFTKTTNWAEYHAVKQDILLKIGRIIAENGGDFAFPTTTLHIPEGLALRSPARRHHAGTLDATSGKSLNTLA